MPNIFLKPITKKPIASLNLPGSKSIANRVLLLASVAKGESVIHNVPEVAEDVVLMLNALANLGVKISKLTDAKSEYATYAIKGNQGKFLVNATKIFCGNSGTTIRFLTAILSLTQGQYALTGIKRMTERPINDLLLALRQLGAQINCVNKDGYPPLHINPFCDTQATKVSISGQTSSQYLTGLLMALPQLHREITVTIYDELISKPYIAITIALLKQFGCFIQEQANNYIIPKLNHLNSITYTIEPDASSASYFLAMGALAGDITINNLSKDSLQGDKDFAKVLGLMGAVVEYASDYIRVANGHLSGITINMQEMPDVAMTLSVVALFAIGTTTIYGIKSWQVKETNRLHAMQVELTKLGATVTISKDTITIIPPLRIKPNMAINTYNDHRMAMCFSLVAVAGIPITINDYQCVGKTFANYFDIFKQICYS